MAEQIIKNNIAEISGKVVSEFTYSHEVAKGFTHLMWRCRDYRIPLISFPLWYPSAC